MTDTDSLIDQAGVSIAVVHLLEYLKRAHWFPWLTEHTDTAYRVVGVVLAFLTAAGFSASLTGSYQTGGMLTVTLPSATVILNTFARCALQYGLQHGYYKRVVARADSGLVAVSGAGGGLIPPTGPQKSSYGLARADTIENTGQGKP